MNLVAPFGFYGWGNIGDESTLQGFARLIEARQPMPSVWVGSMNPEHTKRIEPSFEYFRTERNSLRKRWANYRASAAVFAGGTPIMDTLGEWPLNEVASQVSASSQRGRPVSFVGIGTERLNSPASRDVLENILAPQVHHWSVRSTHDFNRLAGWGVDPKRITVAADLAWLLSATPLDFGRQKLQQLGLQLNRPIVAVNVNGEEAVLQREPKLFEKLGTFLDALIDEQDVQVIFVCSEVREGPTFDSAAAGRVTAAMKRRTSTTLLPTRYWTPQELLSILGCCNLVVSTRYHVCLFSVLQEVPFIAIQRSDKISDLCSDIGWRYGVSLDEVDVPRLLAYEQEIAGQREEIVAFLRRAAAAQRELSRINHVALDALIERLGSSWVQ